ncbi:MAG: hypothetical protein ACXWW5_03005 [Actinomycetota bacterium]
MAPSVLAASTTAVVWLTIGLITILAAIAMLVALVRHGLLIWRAIGRLNDEVAPITSEIQSITASTQRRVSGGRGGRSPRS